MSWHLLVAHWHWLYVLCAFSQFHRFSFFIKSCSIVDGTSPLSRSHMHTRGLAVHSLVDFQLGVKLDSISIPDICTESYECQTCFCNSGSDLIINLHCSGESAPQVGEFIINFSFCQFTVTVGSLYGFPGAGWCTTSVFFVLIVRS